MRTTVLEVKRTLELWLPKKKLERMLPPKASANPWK
jgi:hypothetical protein